MADLTNMKKIILYDVTDEPLWGDDAGRETMDGAYGGTFIGFFSKLIINTGKLNNDEMIDLKAKFKKPYLEVTYIDPDTAKKVKEQFYGTAMSAKLLKLNRYDATTITVIATKRQEDNRVYL